MPLALDLSHKLFKQSTSKTKIMNYYLRPDAKSQVTLEYSDDNKPTRIEAIISTQHDFDEEATMLAKNQKDIIEI
jgi:S-adenosylmethionine synthetase